MIEYIDKRIGKIKVLNVTEARANFANVLGDRGASYIITKNNKPLRVIIGYNDYEALKQSAEARPPAPFDSGAGGGDTVEKQPKKQAKNRVPGLLQTSIALRQTKEEIKKTTGQCVVDETSSNLLEQADDYFISDDDDGDDFGDEALLVTPDSLDDDEEPYATTPVPEQETVDEDRQTSGQEAETELTEQPPPTKVSLPGTKTRQTETQAHKKTKEPAADEDNLTEEQREYFRKYKKLYESMVGDTKEKEFSISLGEAGPVAVEEDTSPTTTEVPVVDTIEQSAQPDCLQTVEQAKETEADLDYEDYQDPAVQESIAEEPRKTIVERGKKNGALPSLRDLLKDLESEKLSGEADEAESLNDSEIDDLINRITQD